MVSLNSPSKTTDYFNKANIDCNAHHKKIKQWFMNLSKYCKEIMAEHQKYQDRCLYHLTKTHDTDACHIKKECDKLIQLKKGLSQSSSYGISANTTGQLHHLTEEEFEDAVSVNVTDDAVLHASHNDTDDNDLQYFSRLTYHYLHLAKVSPKITTVSHHSMKFPIIADSGALSCVLR